MKAVVVYESLWGNTAAIARAIAEGIGNGTQALNTSEATGPAIAGIGLIVAGAPLLAFSLPTEKIRKSIETTPGKAPTPADLSHPSMRSWLETLPAGQGTAAVFETRIWWSPGSAMKTIAQKMNSAGYRSISKGKRFMVKGMYGPLKPGELERARLWGVELSRLLG